ncbi:MAG: S8 family serine peptidase, partial [Planctomycetota bacterium]|nr:S8 family serine peptidase [Planctomycetota bacterium]
MQLLIPLILFAFPAQSTPTQFIERHGELEFSGRMIVRPVSNAPASAVSRLDNLVIRHFPETREYVVSVPEGMTENTLAAAWMATGDYEYVEPDWLCFPLGDPNDPEYGNQWHHVNMESSQGWDLITGDSNQIISWCDTGVDHGHPDLAANLIPGYNAPDQLEEVHGGDTSDINGHGTHVAGCFGAIGNNGVGVAGVTWNMKLMPVRVSNSPSGGAYLSDILDGARWAVDNGAKTVSASYSGVENSSVGTTGTDIKLKGGLFFYAADNSGRNHSSFDYPDTIVVGATDSADQKPSWSSYGKAIDVASPGVGILSTVVGGGYQAWSGTSMA